MRKLVITVLVAATAILPSAAHAFRNFTVPSSSMEPVLGPGDVVTAALYGFDYDALAQGQPLTPSDDPTFQPKRGDVAFFSAEDGTVFVMRIVGLGGDRVQMVGGLLHLNGEPVPTRPTNAVPDLCTDGEACEFFRETPPGMDGGYVVMSQREDGIADSTEAFTVPEGHFFVMGDNRDNANDSRFVGSDFGMVGFVPREAMIGRLHAILYSPRPSPPFADRIAGFPALP
ncbi:signal peptidase I [Antarcticirhabdus aurantiaca]|uniref:Signal peptidase I n=1 Tax=Antarcticirhabdus aurantiaca TaxID=2606717 RepID=A0ACD4NJD7_9HYPH|nr:signal peptidase I [Antarcticirhabdus aurantiaca]WAJ26960.1 signal peptidase I [Jeongeuplla avenae]